MPLWTLRPERSASAIPPLRPKQLNYTLEDRTVSTIATSVKSNNREITRTAGHILGRCVTRVVWPLTTPL